jgi:hypothetical protein
MLKNHPRIYLLIFLFGFFISACAQLGLQSKKEPQEPTSIPACKKNYTKEGNFITGRVYKSWVKYDNLDYKRGFDTAVTVFKSPGHRVIYTDRDSGTINGEMTFGSQEPKMYPVEIKLVKEKTSLTIYTSTKSAVGSSAQETFCSFYEAFEKGIKRAASSPQPKQATVPPKKPQETEKESISPATPPPTATPKPAPTPPSPPAPSSPSKTPLGQAEVTWSHVNFREGPGTKYKVIRKLKKGTPLDILDEEKGWLQVQLDDGTEGWLSKSATSMTVKTPPPPPAPSPRPSAPPPPPPASEPPKPESPM